jgi:PAS domain S-box-containing protein
VLLEATGDDVSRSSLEQLLEALAPHQPTALISPGRCALQFVVETDNAEVALASALSWWRGAVSATGVAQHWTLLRIELMTGEELIGEWREYTARTERITSQQALHAAYEATRQLLRVTDAGAAAAVVARLVHNLGGSIVAASEGDCIGRGFDLSFGTGDEALCATAPPLSVARLHLEEILPAVAEDASELLHMRLRAVVQNVTERVVAEGLRTAVMSQVAAGVCTLDREGRLIYMNSAAAKMLGSTESELRGRNMREAVGLPEPEVPPGGADVAPSEDAEAPPQQYGAAVLTRKDRSTFPVAYSTAPLLLGESLEGAVVVFRDVSEPGSSPNVIRVVIVDPDTTATHSFKALLERHGGIEVVGAATTSASGLGLVDELRPAVVLVNLDLPDREGIVTASMIKYANPSTNVILMTAKHDDTIALASIQAGCAGLLDKSRAWVELVSAVRAAYHGETIIPQGELQRVITKVRGGGHPGRSTQLTDREEEVLAHMREGLSNAQVAERLGVTPNTVRNHVQRILYKLNVHSKLEAVVITSREGLPEGGDRPGEDEPTT